MGKTYRVAIAGCGRMGTQHAVGYANEPRCRIVAVADPQQARAAELLAASAPGAKVYADYRQMLAAERPDLVSLCLWTRLHLPAIRDCVELGIPAVHCEKPMAPTWGAAQEIARLVRGSPTRLTFNHQRRFTPSYATARELLRGGEFGRLERIEAFIPDNILDWGTHLVDLTFFYNGDVPARWVMGQIDARKVGRWFDVPFEFATEATIRFENGVRAAVHSGDDKETRLAVRLTCTEGIIEPYGEIEMRTLRYGPAAGPAAGQWQHRQFEGGPADAGPAAMSALASHLIDTLESGQEPELSLDKALRASEAIFALYESSRRRARIDLPLTIADNPFEAMLERGEIGPG